MKIRPWVSLILILIIIPLTALLSAGCAASNKGTRNTNTSKPPQIPPQSTFIMDFSDFIQGKNSFNLDQNSAQNSGRSSVLWVSSLPDSVLSSSTLYALGDRANWGFAALNVGFWNLVGFAGLAIPVAAFVESIKQNPVKQPDNSWIWTYSITVQGITYTAKLNGKYVDPGVRWDMYVTKQNDFTDFLWYYGESDLGATQGFWILKDNPANPNDLLRIDWHRNPAGETGDIKYTNIVPAGPENGGYISFAVSQDPVYDRSYKIYNKGKNGTTYIEWDNSSKAGRVKDSSHFKDDIWHYWDSYLKDTPQP
jgi:hypothetical protein